MTYSEAQFEVEVTLDEFNSSSVPAHIRLISLQEWDSLRKVLATKRGQDELRSEMSSLLDDGVLHFTCRFHPPIDVLLLMAKTFPGSITQADKAGRYLLHSAAKWGASPKVMQFLMTEWPSIAGLQDGAGKTPLHYMCESYSKNYSPSKNGNLPTNAALIEVVSGLCKVSPSTVNLEDNKEMTALEYALDSNLGLKAISSIQMACEKDWKQRRTQIPGAGHDIVQKKLQEESQMKCERLSKELMEMTLESMQKSMLELKLSKPLKLPGTVGRIPAIHLLKANTSTAFAA